MGRIKKATIMLCALTLLTACNKPGEIDPNLHYIDVSTPGEIPGNESSGLKHDGTDNWGINPEDYGDLEDPTNYNRYITDLYTAKAEYYANLPEMTMDATASTVESVAEDAPTVPKPNFSNISTYTNEELLAAYGDADAYGFFDTGKRNICSRSGQLVEELNNTYQGAVAEFTSLLGEPTVEFTLSGMIETYWFLGTYVYTVASRNSGQTVTKSQSLYVVDNGYYHEDYYHLITKTDTGYTCEDRFTHESVHMEV